MLVVGYFVVRVIIENRLFCVLYIVNLVSIVCVCCLIYIFFLRILICLKFFNLGLRIIMYLWKENLYECIILKKYNGVIIWLNLEEREICFWFNFR